MSEKAEGASEVPSPGLRAGGRKRTNRERPDAWTEFLGVSRQPTGKYGAQIRESKGKAQSHRWLGTFDNAEDAARAYDAAAVELRGGAAITNFKQPASIDDGGGASSLLHVPAEPSGHVARTKFRGVYRQRGGKFAARMRQSKGKSQTWLGSFDTAEDAARAYDAAAVKVHGVRAKTNFKQPAAVDEGVVSPLLAEPSGQGVRRHPSRGEYIAQVCDLNGKAALELGGFDSPGIRHHDLSVDLPPAVDDLLGDMDFTVDKGVIRAAIILQQISLAGHGHGGRESRTNINHERSAAAAN